MLKKQFTDEKKDVMMEQNGLVSEIMVGRHGIYHFSQHGCGAGKEK